MDKENKKFKKIALVILLILVITVAVVILGISSNKKNIDVRNNKYRKKYQWYRCNFKREYVYNSTKWYIP